VKKQSIFNQGGIQMFNDIRDTAITVVSVVLLVFLLPISMTLGFKVAQQIGLVQCYSSQVEKK
jgi:hypothetical protein